jgi:hypothetical protein
MNARLCRWLAQSAGKVCSGRFVDVHIDELDPNLKHPEQWISGIQGLLAEGCDMMSRWHDRRCVLAGCIALRFSSEELGVNFSCERDLNREIDITPPSLYMFADGTEPWADRTQGFVPLDRRLCLSILPQVTILYLEYQEPTEIEFRRSLWLVPRQE